ncbi:hypothetical protein F5882DRAFT_137695 [Hyaloscypha sp. PMI_1271]|nr:hypothetical protein F5882DRAFT_137695 [Hyaloscypha sp. PMI_1271]
MTPLSPGAVQVGPRYELQECVAKGDVTPVIGLLEEHFEEIAQQEFDWLHELLDIGCSFEEMARLLIDGEVSSPWIPIETPFSASKPPSIGLHQPNCVHSGGRKLDTRPRVNSVGLLKTHEALPMSKIKEMIGECCGIAGVLPPNSNPPWWRSGSSLVHFTGERNSVAWISYSKPGVISDLQTLSLNILGALDSILCTIGFLQEVGLCCDSFTILRLEESNKAIELCRVPLSLIKNLRMTVEHWKGNILDSHQRQGCFKSAREIIRSILGDLGTAEIAKIFDTDDPYTTLNVCALVVQILFLGILSYSQAHTGHLRPEFLFEPLEEVHLLGTSMVEFMSRKHVVVELLDFACMKDMLQDSVLVFRLSSDVFGSPSRDSQNSDWITKYDLFASPEDLADTWGPARFVTDSTHGHRLLAIEVGGGTIIRAATGEEKEEKLHWSAGPAPYRAQKLTFNSRDKVLIGATTVNDKCPLDEHKSWRHPLTNAYIQHLGTRDHSWELRERQAGFQGGQYAILQFNATYIKQNGVTLKQQQLMLPFNEIDLAFLNSNCGLQISFCTGLSRRVALRELLADVVVPFIESRLAKPAHWEELKTQYAIVENFRHGDLETWFDQLSLSLRETAIHIVRSMLEVLKDTGIDRNGEELVIAWVRKESPYSCLRLRCEKTSLWARILADSEDCATFACITPLCLEIRQHACRNLEVAPWHNVSNLLDTEVCQHLSNRDIQTVTNTLAPWTLQHQVSYWIGKSGTNLIAKVWLTNEDAEPRLVVRQKVIPEKYRARLPRVMVERLGRLREKQIGDSIAKQVVILAQI